MLMAKRPLFAVRHHGQPIRSHAQLNQIIADCLGALFSEHEIVGSGATLVAMPLDFQLSTWISPHPFHITGQGLSALFRDCKTVIAEKDVTKAGSGRRRLLRTDLFKLSSR